LAEHLKGLLSNKGGNGNGECRNYIIRFLRKKNLKLSSMKNSS